MNIPNDLDYLIDALRATPITFESLMRICTQEQAQAARGGDENWSIVEVMCHLRDNEERALERMRLMRDQINPVIVGYDQEVWAHERNYAADNLRNAFEAFKKFRAQHIAELAALSPAAWERTGQHEERGRVTIHSQIVRAVCHDAIHLAQVTRQLNF